MLGRVRRLIQRLGGFAASFIFSSALALFSIPFIVDALGSVIWSSLAVSQSISALVGMIVAFGWGTVGAATVASEPPVMRRQLFVESLIARTYLFAVLAPLLFVLILVTGGPLASLSAFASVTYLLPALGASWYFVGEVKPWRLFFCSVLPQGLGTIAGVIVLLLNPDPVWFVACQFVFNIIAIIISAFVIIACRTSETPLRFELSIRSVGRNLGSQKHGVIASAMGTINNSLPLVVVSVVAPGFVAVYAMADRLFRFAIATVGPLLQVAQGWIPEAGESIAQRRIALLAKVSPVMGALGGIGLVVLLPAASQLFSHGEIIVGLDLSIPFGMVFASVAVAQIIGLACLIPLGKGALLAKSTAAGTLVNVPLMFLLTFWCGAPGTAWGIAIAETLITGWQLIVTHRITGSSRFVGKWIPGVGVMPPSGRHFSRE